MVYLFLGNLSTKKAVEPGGLDDILELVFIPLYGKDNEKLAKTSLGFEPGLYKTNRISKPLVAELKQR